MATSKENYAALKTALRDNKHADLQKLMSELHDGLKGAALDEPKLHAPSWLRCSPLAHLLDRINENLS